MVSPRPRAKKVTAVAQPRAARTKNCQGWSRPTAAGCDRSGVVSGFSRTCSVEVPELIVEAFFEAASTARGSLGRRLAPPRPLDGREADGHGAGGADQVRETARRGG